MYNNFLDSPKGRLHAYRKRKKRAFEFWWSGKLQTKNSASLEESARFQTALAQSMEARQRRGPFTGPIIVEFDFWPASRNPPHVHQLAKHYLDLLQKPVEGASIARSRLLMRDDSQVEFLTCLYDPRMDEDGLRVRVRRLRDFFEDLELYSDLAEGLLESRFEFTDIEDQSVDESRVDDYLDFLAGKTAFVRRYGQSTFESWDLMYKRDAQTCLLSQRELSLKQLSILFRPRYHRLRNDSTLASIMRTTSRMVRTGYEQPFMSIDFGARALRKGESKEFGERVRKRLNKARDRYPLLDPLLVPCAVTVLYLPPRKAPKVDLDNLLRKSIIPAVHEILQPPATPRDFLTRIDSGTLADPQFADMLARYKQAPDFHVAGYQVFCLPRTDDDPENGNVRLILHHGDPSHAPWQLLDDALTQWEDSDHWQE